MKKEVYGSAELECALLEGKVERLSLRVSALFGLVLGEAVLILWLAMKIGGLS